MIILMLLIHFHFTHLNKSFVSVAKRSIFYINSHIKVQRPMHLLPSALVFSLSLSTLPHGNTIIKVMHHAPYPQTRQYKLHICRRTLWTETPNIFCNIFIFFVDISFYTCYYINCLERQTNADVAEWQTHQTQNLTRVTSWGFKSLHPH